MSRLISLLIICVGFWVTIGFFIYGYTDFESLVLSSLILTFHLIVSIELNKIIEEKGVKR